MKKSIFFLILWVGSLPIYAQSEKLKSVDSLINQLLSEYTEIPSFAITVVEENKTLFSQTYGYSDVEKRIPTTPSTPYYIASATKSFVGLLAAQLEHDGILDLEKSISEYAPIKYFTDRSIFEDISITQLLTHTSGIRNDVLSWQFSLGGSYTRPQLNKLLEHKTSSLHNEQSFRYDNLGYNILDLILYEEFGIDWKKTLQEKIFNPLKMTRTSADHSTLKRTVLYAQPYTAMNDDRRPTLASTQKDDATFQAAGGMLSSIVDLQNWLLININEGRLYDQAVIAKEALENAQGLKTKVRGREGPFIDYGYGLGWFHSKFHDQEVIYHTGGFDGFFAMISFIKEKNIGVAVLVNESHFGDNVGKLITAFAYDLLLGNKDSISDYNEPLTQLRARIDRIQAGSARNRKIRSYRTWTLSLPMHQYTGSYENEYLGKLTIHADGYQPHVQLGISRGVAEPSSSEDSMRVELSDGRGQDLLFIYHKNQVHALVMGGMVFYRNK